MNPSKMDVNTPNAAYRCMADAWAMIDSLLAGTQAMRDAGEKYLPRNSAETPVRYQKRIGRTFLYNGFKRTVTSLVGKPFSEDVHIAAEVPPKIQPYLQDVDLLGHDLTSFAEQLAKDGLAKGICHFLVEFPRVEGRITIAQKEDNEIRPYFLRVDPNNLIGWQYVITAGKYVLTQLRIRQVITRQVDEFNEEQILQVRVYDRSVDNSGTPIVVFRLFEQRTDPNNAQSLRWDVVETGVATTDEIPLVTTYFGERCDFMKAEIPLLDLAWLNIEHWQSSSEQRNILNVARIPFWVLTGYSPETDDEGNESNTVKIGSDQMLRFENPEAKLNIVETNGNAIGLGRNDLQDIEARMSIQGAALLYKKTGKGDTTATESAHDAESEDCSLSSMMKNLEVSLSNGIRLMEEWENIPETPGKLVTINTDFGIEPQDAADLQSLYQSRMAGQITHLTYLKELQRRKVLAPSVKIEDEVKAAKAEGPVPLPQKDNTSSTMNAGPNGMTQKDGAGA